jgi:hydrogenase expression/formation protein HypD
MARRDFRDRELALKASREINNISNALGKVKIMHVCGTHEDTITRFGIRSLLPENVEVISGPGCPVCVTTIREVDEVIYLARQGITITTFGDMFRVPGSYGSLADAKADGNDIRVVYSITDAGKIARENSKDEIVHMAIGFETTAPSTAVEIRNSPENFSILSCHRLIPPAMEFLLKEGDVKVDGFINPGHVSTIIGLEPYRPIAKRYKIPQVVAGFEPLDMLFAILMLLRMIRDGSSDVKNEYTRIVREKGNVNATEVMNSIFEKCDVEWRGFPVIEKSGLKLRGRFSEHDARKRFEIKVKPSRDPDGCRCGDVLKGLIYPGECPLFGKACNPKKPIGPCMVSSEGACSIAYKSR